MPSDWGLSSLPSERDVSRTVAGITGGGRVSGLLINEYGRVTSALSHMSPLGEEATRASLARRIPDQAGTRYINVPGWDDVIRVAPKERLTRQELEAHREARAQGRASPLSTDRLAVHGERIAEMQGRQNSTSPEYAKNWAQMQTAVDNVQDLLSTVATLGRLVINPIARLALHNVGAETGFLLRAGVMSGRLASRFIPGIGWVLLAADILNLLNLLGTMAFPLYASYCGATFSGIVGAIPSLLLQRGLCKKITDRGSYNPFSKQAKYARWQRSVRARPSIFNLLEVAQTSDSLFGVGLSYGGIWGLATDASFAMQQAALGQNVGLSTPTGRKEFASAYSDRMQQATRSQLRDYRVASQVLATAPQIARVQEIFTVQEHLAHLIAVTVALDLLRPFIEHPDTDALVAIALTEEWAPPNWSPWSGDDYQTAHGLGTAPTATWALPGTPARITGDALCTQTAPEIATAMKELLTPIRDDEAGAFAGALITQIIDRCAVLWSTDEPAVEWETAPDQIILLSLASAGVIPNVRSGEGPLLSFWESARAVLVEKVRRGFTREELRSLLDAAGVKYFLMQHPTEPFPAELKHLLHGEVL